MFNRQRCSTKILLIPLLLSEYQQRGRGPRWGDLNEQIHTLKGRTIRLEYWCLTTPIALLWHPSTQPTPCLIFAQFVFDFLTTFDKHQISLKENKSEGLLDRTAPSVIININSRLHSLLLDRTLCYRLQQCSFSICSKLHVPREARGPSSKTTML